MTQDQWITLLLKIVLVCAFLSLVAWVLDYTRLAPWWSNPIGRTLVIKTSLIAVLLVPSIISLFFGLNRLTSHLVAWIDVGLIGLITPVMLWRIVVFRRIHDGTDSGVPGGS